MPEQVSSHSNPLVKQVRSLRQRKGREDTGLFLVEGIHHVGEAVEAGWRIEALIYAPEQLTSDFGRRLVDGQARGGVRCVAMTEELFTAIAEKDNPQGILAVVSQKHLGFNDIIPGHFHFGAALVSPQDPGNVGTILRTLDAVEADGLFLLDGGVDLYHPSSVRASMGAIFWKTVVQAPFSDFVEWARRNGYQLVGSSVHAKVDYRAFERGGRATILVLGNEQKGLSQGQMAACDVTVGMPMKGRVSSLNLAVAAGILLFEIMK